MKVNNVSLSLWEQFESLGRGSKPKSQSSHQTNVLKMVSVISLTVTGVDVS